MNKPCIKKVVRLSWIREQARQEFEEMKHNQELDPAFFTDKELEYYVGVLIRSYAEDWLVIDA